MSGALARKSARAGWRGLWPSEQTGWWSLGIWGLARRRHRRQTTVWPGFAILGDAYDLLRARIYSRTARYAAQLVCLSCPRIETRALGTEENNNKQRSRPKPETKKLPAQAHQMAQYTVCGQRATFSNGRPRATARRMKRENRLAPPRSLHVRKSFRGRRSARSQPPGRFTPAVKPQENLRQVLNTDCDKGQRLSWCTEMGIPF